MQGGIAGDNSEEAITEFFREFDILAERAVDTVAPTVIVYNGTVGVRHPLEQVTVKAIMALPAMTNKTVGMYPNSEENKLDVVDLERNMLLGEIINPPKALLDELKALCTC